MAATITPTAESPGKGGKGAPIFWGGPRTIVARNYTVAWGTHYPVAGVDVSSIFNDFATGGLLQLIVPGFVAGRFVRVDYTAKTILLYTAVSTVAADDTDQSAIDTIRVTAIGYPA
jgi:hypothetical protein